MNSKKWIKILLILCVFGVGFVGGVNYLVDPFQQYRVKTFYPIAFKNKFGFFPFEKENPNPKDMTLEKFNFLVEQISSFSEDAVIGLSAWGEPLLNKNFSEFRHFVDYYMKKDFLTEDDLLDIIEANKNIDFKRSIQFTEQEWKDFEMLLKLTEDIK